MTLRMVFLSLSSLLSLAFFPTANASCTSSFCRLTVDGAYEHLVVGRLVQVANDEEFEQVFHAAKQQGQWQQLPNTFSPYQQHVVLVSIAIAEQQAPVSLFLTREEYEAAPFNIGSLVRYRPHDPEREAPSSPEESQLYWGLTGCVAALCSPDDQACAQRYSKGVFSIKGQPVSFETGNIINANPVIDPTSLLPINP